MTTELTAERKAEIDAETRQRMEYFQREYWRARNGVQRFIRCPFCTPFGQKIKRRNFIGSPKFCCAQFAKMFKAVLERQDEVDKAASAARNIMTIAKMVEKQSGIN